MAEHCFIQLRERRGGDPGAIDQGWFIIKDGFVILTDEHDKPLFDAAGRYEQRLAKGDNPKDIAAVLLRGALRIAAAMTAAARSSIRQRVGGSENGRVAEAPTATSRNALRR